MKITIDSLRKTYGRQVALDIPSLSIEEGEIIGLVGNNGAGKTTLFRLMLDLLQGDSGSVTIGDVNVCLNEKWKETTGAYLDESFLIDYLTPEEYFDFVGRMCGLTSQTVRERLQLYERFMNGEIMGQQKLIRNLSAGNRQKVGILAALINRPQVIILDEPFNFLDPSSQMALKYLLQEYNEQTGATVLVSSHNLGHTVDISTRILLLEHGELVADLDNREGAAREKLEVYFNMAAKPVSEKDNDGAVAAPNGEHAGNSQPDEQLAESPELEQPNGTEENLQAETEGVSASASETDPDATTKAGA